ncbi:proline dehydrogenase family protein [Arsenicicoccus dermatophilus]|uniref:proline dehydrogenase family protein n=1 Tax=Arsenicicoccus dermatophilus TaxID=1076331 RepID=UPI001F4C6F76|nr:bifunctional proline dehydrogenase/L-glutamate gamma-semialdehyde dehydrogenase [Arsenicicoccus dermatophilus]MCH8614264.1 bifunctional proline dehydrogenase/L-glutamate gamma-semialdehyde dehydrogenase [Arsenicicoccus dermatophilus]
MTDHRRSDAPLNLPTGPAAVAAIADEAVEVARRWARATAKGATRSERATSAQLGALLRDETGLDLAVTFVDEVARPEDPYVAAKVLSTITASDAGSFLGPVDRSLLGLGARVAPLAPPVVVSIARKRLRQIVGHLVADATDPGLARHLAAARAEGFRLNVNLLGEAVLGEQEAASRTERTRALLARPDVDYVSIKVSSLVSQISTWDTEGTVERVLERLRPLYRTAAHKQPKAFVNLDMEEYKDLDLTMEVFERMLREEEFHDLEAGIVLQAYLPDAIPALERLIRFAQERHAAGHAGIKIRVVKGANLAMERAEAEVHGWEQAPYPTKEDVDANYLSFVERALRPDATEVMRLGVASHNLFDTAVAYLLARQRGCLDALDVEMLQGMAPSQARAVREDVGSVLLYTPVVAPEDFDVAVSYLIRRLEENAQPQNFLHAMFAADPQAGAKGRGRSGPDSGSHDAMADQERRFRESVAAMATTPIGPRRTPERAAITDRFDNTADSDPALPAVREWARRAVTADPAPLTSPVLESAADVDAVVARAVAAAPAWAGRSARGRADVLREAARRLEARRGELITVMAAEGGKTVAEGDPEVSEAVDFARYYADRALELDLGASAHTDGSTFTPDRVVLVTPPWNFPVAIPIGGVLAALAAGAAVIIKPAAPTTGCVEVAAAALWEAGVPREALQVVRCDEGDVGQALVAHRDVDTVVLTGATETAELFAGWRAQHPAGPRVYGETSGKNALVITPAADLDLAAADLVRSAFGHAGQKCSAASLGILVGSVGRSERFRHQLVDAVRSLRVGWPQDLGATMGPVIEPPSDKLLRALTTLEPGETWLVEPKQLDTTGRLWSPGVKDGVRPGSFFHLTEVFGPVLGLMRARTLQEATELQDATAYGLTGGLHSLDADEIAWWTDHVQVGNAYVNRHTTGAIVRRQSFGGWKGSVVGPGAKAGGPNYVALLGRWAEEALPTQGTTPAPRVRALVDRLAPLVPAVDRPRLEAALRSDAQAWRSDLGIEHDESALSVEANVFRYRPHPEVLVRLEEGARSADLVRLLAAAALAGSHATVSVDPAVAGWWEALATGSGEARQAADDLRDVVRVEDRAAFVARVGEAGPTRVRVVGQEQPLVRELAGSPATLLTGPVLANGRRELLTFLREQAISRTLHRYGHVAPDLAR